MFFRTLNQKWAILEQIKRSITLSHNVYLATFKRHICVKRYVLWRPAALKLVQFEASNVLQFLYLDDKSLSTSRKIDLLLLLRDAKRYKTTLKRKRAESLHICSTRSGLKTLMRIESTSQGFVVLTDSCYDLTISMVFLIGLYLNWSWFRSQLGILKLYFRWKLLFQWSKVNHIKKSKHGNFTSKRLWATCIMCSLVQRRKAPFGTAGTWLDTHAKKSLKSNKNTN